MLKIFVGQLGILALIRIEIRFSRNTASRFQLIKMAKLATL